MRTRDDISILALYGLRFLCFWAQQEKDNGGNQGRDCDSIGQKFTSAYLYAPNNSTLVCQALSPKLLFEDWQRDYTFIKDLVEDLISALLQWGADAAVDDPCTVSGQRPLHCEWTDPSTWQLSTTIIEWLEASLRLEPTWMPLTGMRRLRWTLLSKEVTPRSLLRFLPLHYHFIAKCHDS